MTLLSEVTALDAEYVMGTYGRSSVEFVRGLGTELFDSEGRRYLDFLSGLAVTSLGHAHPAVAAAISEQSTRLLHVSNLFHTEHQAPVEDVRASHAGFECRHTRFELGDHAFGDLSIGDELLHAGHVDTRDERARIGPIAVDALDIGEVHELLGVERFGHRARDRVGVDVVRLAMIVDANRRDHRDELFAQHALHDRGIDLAHITDEPEQRVALIDTDKRGVFAGKSDRVGTVAVHRRDDLAVDLADQRHAHDVDGFGVGDAPAVDELGFLAEPAHEIADLRTAAVHDDRVHADETHEHDVGGEEIRECRIGHRVAAVLDHDGLARELADIRQRFGEDDRLLPRRSHALVGTCDGFRGHDVRRFSSMYACERSVVSTVASPCAWRRSHRISISRLAMCFASAASSCVHAMPSRQLVTPL